MPNFFQAGIQKPDVQKLADLAGFNWLLKDEAWLKEDNHLPLWLDVGAGMGRFLLSEADKHPDIRFLGVEPDLKCARTVLKKFHRRELHQEHIGRVRHFWGTISHFLDMAEAHSVDRIFFNYPDPWFKKKHLKRRLLKADLLNRIHGVLKPGADVLIQTDIDDYAQCIALELQDVRGYEINPKPETLFADLTVTLYQEKALKAGHSRYFFHLKAL